MSVLSQVNSAQVQDSGRYSCQASNVAGKTEKSYNLNVWGELKFLLSRSDTVILTSTLICAIG